MKINHLILNHNLIISKNKCSYPLTICDLQFHELSPTTSRTKSEPELKRFQLAISQNNTAVQMIIVIVFGINGPQVSRAQQSVITHHFWSCVYGALIFFFILIIQHKCETSRSVHRI